MQLFGGVKSAWRTLLLEEHFLLEENVVVFLCSIKSRFFSQRAEQGNVCFFLFYYKDCEDFIKTAFSWHMKHNSKHWKEIDLTGKSSS